MIFKKLFSGFLFTILFVFLNSLCVYSQPSQTIKEKEYVLYIPADIDLSQPHPLIVALSPVADPFPMLFAWEDVAKKYKWFLYCDRVHKRGDIMKKSGVRIMRNITYLLTQYPIDRTKIVATGFSAGGMTSYALLFDHGDMFHYAVINSGIIHNDYKHKLSRRTNPGSGKKIAILMPGTEDGNYIQMTKDRDFLQDRGWKIKWIPFSGGHRIAPPEAYMKAGDFLHEYWQK